MGNTGKVGLHLACMGEAWQAALLTLQHPSEQLQMSLVLRLKARYNIGWVKYCKSMVPAAILAVLVSMVCLYFRYFVI